MLTTLIHRELLDHLMTFHFAASILITLLLVVANTAVLIDDYERRLASYNTAVKTHQQRLQQSKTYSAGELVVDRPPNPLSIFNVGLDKRLGNTLEVYHGYVPTLWDASMHGSDNSFMNIFSSIDIAFIFEVVLSLMALMFAYDALAGEHERGTLRLVLTYPASRGHILLAKYIAAMLCLLVPLLLGFLLAIILLTTSPTVSFSMPDFLRVGGIVLTSLVYVSAFYLTGILISAASRRTSTALMLSMFVWGGLVLVYPNMLLAAIQQTGSPETRTAGTFNQIRQMWETFDKERQQFLTTDPVPGESIDFNIEIEGTGYTFEFFDAHPSTLLYFYQSGVHYENVAKKSQSNVKHAQNYFRFLGRRVINMAERTWIVRKSALERTFVRPTKIKKALLKFSPAGIYDAATQAWSGTDYLGLRDFFAAARQYRVSIINYFYDKKAFSSEQWFSADQGEVDWHQLPQFSFQRSGVGINAARALPDLFLLLMINGGLFIGTLLIFATREV